MPRRDAADLGEPADPPLGLARVVHRHRPCGIALGRASGPKPDAAYASAASRAGARDARAARREARDRRSPRAARARGAASAVSDASRRERAEPLGLGRASSRRVAHRVAHLVALDPDPAREVVGEVVGRLGRQRRPAEPGEQQLLERRAAPAVAVPVPVHAASRTRTEPRPSALAGAAVRAARAARPAAVAAGRARRRRRRDAARASARARSELRRLGAERRGARASDRPADRLQLAARPRACGARTRARAP